MKNQFSKVNFENNYFPGSQKFAVEMGDYQVPRYCTYYFTKYLKGNFYPAPKCFDKQHSAPKYFAYEHPAPIFVYFSVDCNGSV